MQKTVVDTRSRGAMVELDIRKTVQTVIDSATIQSLNTPAGRNDMDFKDDIYKQSDLLKKVENAKHGNCRRDPAGLWELSDHSVEYYTIIRTGQHMPLEAYQFECSSCGIQTQEILTNT